MRRNYFPWLLLGPAVMLVNAAWAGTRDDVLSTAIRCGGITDDRQWLDCYYGAAQPMRSQLGLSPAPQTQQRLSAGVGALAPISPPPPAINSPMGPGGFPGATARTPLPPADGIAPTGPLHMVDFSFDRNGMFTATLSNGQVWRQLSGDTSQARWNKPAQEHVYNVSITRGALGSYNFRVVGAAGSYKVSRLR